MLLIRNTLRAVWEVLSRCSNYTLLWTCREQHSKIPEQAYLCQIRESVCVKHMHAHCACVCVCVCVYCVCVCVYCVCVVDCALFVYA